MEETITIPGGSLLDGMLDDIDYPKDSNAGKLYPFFVRVGCVKRRPPRHPFFECILHLGQMDLEAVIDGTPIESEVLAFIFPERWMNVQEQMFFMKLLVEHPDSKSIKQVDIITSSPLIIGHFFPDQLRSITWDDDKDLETT